MHKRFGWGHININVSNLDTSIGFYQKLGFELFLPGIPYLGLASDKKSSLHGDSAKALGIPKGTLGRACIMQLDDGFPKLDLTELGDVEQRQPLENKDLGVVRLCLASRDLEADYNDLRNEGVEFLSAPTPCHARLADVAICVDPDGSQIELLQVYLDRWRAILEQDKK